MTAIAEGKAMESLWKADDVAKYLVVPSFHRPLLDKQGIYPLYQAPRRCPLPTRGHYRMGPEYVQRRISGP